MHTAALLFTTPAGLESLMSAFGGMEIIAALSLAVTGIFFSCRAFTHQAKLVSENAAFLQVYVPKNNENKCSAFYIFIKKLYSAALTAQQICCRRNSSYEFDHWILNPIPESNKY